jgi:hypothetical protein
MIQLRNPHMTVASPENLKPRKTPRQARAEATVDAILEATIQVLLSEGAGRLTTTRVAARAGVSVGTMYQYFRTRRRCCTLSVAPTSDGFRAPKNFAVVRPP